MLGSNVTMAEPLAFVPELSVLVQGPIREEQTLKELIRSALTVEFPDAAIQGGQRAGVTGFGPTNRRRD